MADSALTAAKPEYRELEARDISPPVSPKGGRSASPRSITPRSASALRNELTAARRAVEVLKGRSGQDRLSQTENDRHQGDAFLSRANQRVLQLEAELSAAQQAQQPAVEPLAAVNQREADGRRARLEAGARLAGVEGLEGAGDVAEHAAQQRRIDELEARLVDSERAHQAAVAGAKVRRSEAEQAKRKLEQLERQGASADAGLLESLRQELAASQSSKAQVVARSAELEGKLRDAEEQLERQGASADAGLLESLRQELAASQSSKAQVVTRSAELEGKLRDAEEQLEQLTGAQLGEEVVGTLELLEGQVTALQDKLPSAQGDAALVGCLREELLVSQSSKAQVMARSAELEGKLRDAEEQLEQLAAKGNQLSDDVIRALELRLVAQERKARLVEVFSLFDLDGSGKIEASELLELGKLRRELGHKSGEWTEEMNQRLLKRMDTSGDGVVSMAEFVSGFNDALPADAAEFDSVANQFAEVGRGARRARLKALESKVAGLASADAGLLESLRQELAASQSSKAQVVTLLTTRSAELEGKLRDAEEQLEQLNAKGNSSVDLEASDRRTTRSSSYAPGMQANASAEWRLQIAKEDLAQAKNRITELEDALAAAGVTAEREVQQALKELAVVTEQHADERKRRAEAEGGIAVLDERLQAQERKARLVEVFSLFDLDGTGSIEASELLELGKLRRELGHKSGEWTEEMNQRLLKRMDTSGDGVVSMVEFVSGFNEALPADAAEFDSVVNQFAEVGRGARRARLTALESKVAGLASADAGLLESLRQELAASQSSKAQVVTRSAELEGKLRDAEEQLEQFEQQAGIADERHREISRALELRLAGQERKTRLVEVFSLFDLDGSGKIEASELLELGKLRRELGHKSGEWTEEMNQRLLKRMDTSGDGVVSMAEFVSGFNEALPADAAEFGLLANDLVEVGRSARKKKIIELLSFSDCSATEDEAPVEADRVVTSEAFISLQDAKLKAEARVAELENNLQKLEDSIAGLPKSAPMLLERWEYRPKSKVKESFYVARYVGPQSEQVKSSQNARNTL